MSGEDGGNPAAEEQISKWLDLVWRLEPGDYKEVEDFRELPDAPGVQQDSIFWADKFFTGGAGPYRAGQKARRSIHRATPGTFDTVRHEYDIAAQHLVVEETANFILVTVDWPAEDLAALPEKTKHDGINQLAGLILKLNGTMVAPNLQDIPYHWAFRLPPNIVEGTRFSTDPAQDPYRMWSWASRVDGGIHRNRLYFLCFKKRESTSGRYFFPDGQHWFDGRAWAGAERPR